MTVAPAAAQVASMTMAGMAEPESCSQGSGPMPTQPRMVLKTPWGDAS